MTAAQSKRLRDRRSAGDTGIQLAKSTSSKDRFLKADKPKTSATRAKQRLTRVPFTVSRLMEFCTRRELVNQTGHDVIEWALVMLKELVDNAIDACEEAEIAPVISVTVEGGSIVIEDNGSGIPAKTIEGVLDYSVRVSSREAYVSPTRGAQGNALQTILPMAYVLDERHGEDASGKTTIEAHGIAHHIEFSVPVQSEGCPQFFLRPGDSPLVCKPSHNLSPNSRRFGNGFKLISPGQ
jgi:Histidine kinase-, DNA gyrase B-, and HSP90-like ATPase